MNNRELFHATMRRENDGRLLHMEQGFNISRSEWLAEGLPPTVSTDGCPQLEGGDLFEHMNVSGYAYCHFQQFCIPEFEQKVLEEGDKTRVEISPNGVTRRVMTKGHGSPPHEIDFAIQTPADYREHRHRLTGNIDRRVDTARWAETGPRLKAQVNHPVTLWTHGPFAFLRELVGTENAMILPYTEEAMIKLMLRDHLEKCMAAAAPVIEACKPDMCFVWEDCCGSTGPFIAPDIFEKLMAPWYREWKDYLVGMGVPWIMLDTDGDPGPLVRNWYEAGVDCLQPWEVNSVDMLRFAEEFTQYVMMGGIYKHMFEPNDPAQVGRFKTADLFEAIDQELERVVKPMAGRGGYIAALDHWAFWGTTYKGYKHYAKELERYGKANRWATVSK